MGATASSNIQIQLRSPEKLLGQAADRGLVNMVVPVGRLQQLSLKLKIPPDVLKQGYEVFASLCSPPENLPPDVTYDTLQHGELHGDGFAKVLCKLTNCADKSELADGFFDSVFTFLDTDDSKSLDFTEFILWFSRHGFSENVLLSEEQRKIRQIARTHGMDIVQVESFKAAFDGFDLDKSGEIDFEEFEKLLYALVKVPSHLDLPKSRLNQFWAECDVDGSGAISFEEFLEFYQRYFMLRGRSQQGAGPFEEFYRRLRPVSVYVRNVSKEPADR